MLHHIAAMCGARAVTTSASDTISISAIALVYISASQKLLRALRLPRHWLVLQRSP